MASKTVCFCFVLDIEGVCDIAETEPRLAHYWHWEWDGGCSGQNLETNAAIQRWRQEPRERCLSEPRARPSIKTRSNNTEGVHQGSIETRSNSSRSTVQTAISGSTISEHRSWVDSDVYDLVDMRTHSPRIFVKGRLVLTVKRNERASFSSVRQDGF